MTNEELRNTLLSAPKNGYAEMTDAQRKAMNDYCKRYAGFMDACKTEREATTWAVAEAEKNGFKPFCPNMDAKPGDKYGIPQYIYKQMHNVKSGKVVTSTLCIRQ